jgi:hypothetical protein
MSCIAKNASNMQTGLPTMTQTIRYMTVAEARENQNRSDKVKSPSPPHTCQLKKPQTQPWCYVFCQVCASNMKPARLVSNNKIKTFEV